MDKIDVAGLKIDSLTKSELLENLHQRIKNGQKTWLTTPYSEFLHAALLDPELMELLNRADIAVPDGIGIFWAARYLSIPLTAKTYWGKILQAAWQVKYSLAAIIFYSSYIRGALDTLSLNPSPGGGGKHTAEKISGADLVWDLAKLAADNHLSVYLLGGFGDTPKLATEKLTSSIDTGRDLLTRLKIAGWSNKNPTDPTVIEDIKKAAPDILLVAYGPIKQERWIAANLVNLPVKLAVGLGGTFDYLADKQPQPPQFLRQAGLEWLWRLLTQPKRYRRIINATLGLASQLWHYKVFNVCPIRKNAVAVIINNNGQVFVGRKFGSRVDIITTNDKQKWKNYWQLPQGGIETTEDVTAAIKREIKEETGMKSLEFIKFSAKHNTYIWNNALRKFWNNRNYRYKGQTQTVVYLKFLGSNKEIVLPQGEEFVEYQWVRPEDLDKIIHPERINLTKIVMEDLKDLA